MCIKLKKHKNFYLDRSGDGHQFMIEKIKGKLFSIIVRVKGGQLECEMTKEFNNVFEMNALCNYIIEKDRG